MRLLGNLKSVKCLLTTIFCRKIFGNCVSLLKFATIQLRRGGSSPKHWFPGMFVFRNVNHSANLTWVTVVRQTGNPTSLCTQTLSIGHQE